MTLSEDSEGHEHLQGALYHPSLCEKPFRLLQRQILSPHLKFWSTYLHTRVCWPWQALTIGNLHVVLRDSCDLSFPHHAWLLADDIPFSQWRYAEPHGAGSCKW